MVNTFWGTCKIHNSSFFGNCPWCIRVGPRQPCYYYMAASSPWLLLTRPEVDTWPKVDLRFSLLELRIGTRKLLVSLCWCPNPQKHWGGHVPMFLHEVQRGKKNVSELRKTVRHVPTEKQRKEV